jgi:crotonobetainyl-CoA:carnitine CoA-transferase CaiB-like acyl-CoA transferase
LGPSFVAVNAGKPSIALDLEDPRGRAIILDLVEGFDVVPENFRPYVMTRVGLDHPLRASRNPRPAYCAIEPFDQIVQGLAGVMSVTGDEHSAPLRTGFPICDTIGGIAAAFCRRARPGRTADPYRSRWATKSSRRRRRKSSVPPADCSTSSPMSRGGSRRCAT